MLESTKASMATEAAFCISSISLLRHIVATLCQKCWKLSVPPNNVVKIGESASRMWLPRLPCGGISRLSEATRWLPQITAWGLVWTEHLPNAPGNGQEKGNGPRHPHERSCCRLIVERRDTPQVWD